MTLLTQNRIEDIMIDLGTSYKQARIFAAIALCESPASMANGKFRSDFGAIGDIELATEVWGYSYGGFQVRSLRADSGTGSWRDAERLLTPRFNCRAAMAIRKSSGFGAWSTYTSGMYKAYLQDLYPPAPGTYIVVGGDTLGSIAAKLGGFTWQQLAMENGLHSPYTIRIGQVLVLP